MTSLVHTRAATELDDRSADTGVAASLG